MCDIETIVHILYLNLQLSLDSQIASLNTLIIFTELWKSLKFTILMTFYCQMYRHLKFKFIISDKYNTFLFLLTA